MSGAKHTSGLLVLSRHGTIIAGPVRQFARGSGQSQFAMLTSSCIESEDGVDAIVHQNARRVVACWNAFDNMSTEEIEALGAGGASHIIAKAVGSAP